MLLYDNLGQKKYGAALLLLPTTSQITAIFCIVDRVPLYSIKLVLLPVGASLMLCYMRTWHTWYAALLLCTVTL